MLRKHYVPVIAAALLLPTALFAADLSGTWKGAMQSGGDAVFELKADKGVVTGNMLGQDGKKYAVTGKQDGDNISLNVAFEWQGQPVTLLVTGKIAGDDLPVHIATDNGYWGTDAALKRQK